MATNPVGECIGNGHFGLVFLEKDAATEDLMADKRLQVEGLSNDQLEKVEIEIWIMLRLKHPHIVMLNGYKKTNRILHIYMEYMPGRDLDKLITEYRNTKKTFAEATIVRYLAQLLSAVGYIHKKKLIHRDLKPANILLSEDKQLVKVTDFGVSTSCESFATKHKTFIGTVAYMAPEMAEAKPYKHKFDVWSLGVIAYELVELKLPIQAMNTLALLVKIAKGEIEPMTSRGSASLREVILLMLKKEGDSRPECSVLLQNALFEGIPDISTLRIKETSLGEVWQAAYKGDLNRLRLLLQDSSNDRVLMDGLYETDTWLKRTTPFMAAACEGRVHVLKWIIRNNKARVEKRGIIKGSQGECGGMTALLIACRQGHVSVVDTLIDDGAADGSALDDEGRTAIMWAAVGGHCDVIRGLIKRGGKVGDRNKTGNTALHCAAHEGNVPCIELLILEGTEINVKDNQQFTPLHSAAQYGHTSAIESLLRNGANREARNVQQATPLCMAASNGHVNVVRLLVEKGANINVRGFKKRTLLHHAARNGHVSVISFLLEARCDATLTDEDGLTPKALAEAKNHPEAARLLGQ